MQDKLTFLFWNINQKPLYNQISNLLIKYDVDILILAELNVDPLKLTDLIKTDGLSTIQYIPNRICDKVHFFSKKDRINIETVDCYERYTIKKLVVKENKSILIGGLHLASKMYLNDFQRLGRIFTLSENIRRIENVLENSKTLLIGDFNMNPFEQGMVLFNGLNAVMTQTLARRKAKMVEKKDYPYFYNPMWSFLGDLRGQISGTYFYNDEFGWQMFDQLLLRPTLIDNFEKDSLEIITSDGVDNFLNAKGNIRSKRFSDHLPIKFTLKI